MELLKLTFTRLSPSSNPQLQGGVQGERMVPPTHARVDPII